MFVALAILASHSRWRLWEYVGLGKHVLNCQQSSLTVRTSSTQEHGAEQTGICLQDPSAMSGSLWDAFRHLLPLKDLKRIGSYDSYEIAVATLKDRSQCRGSRR